MFNIFVVTNIGILQQYEVWVWKLDRFSLTEHFWDNVGSESPLPLKNTENGVIIHLLGEQSLFLSMNLYKDILHVNHESSGPDWESRRASSGKNCHVFTGCIQFEVSHTAPSNITFQTDAFHQHILWWVAATVASEVSLWTSGPWSWNARHVLHWCQSSTQDVTNHYSSSVCRPLHTAALILRAYISTGLHLHRLLVLVGGIVVHFLFHCDPPAGLFLQSDPAHHMFSSFSLPLPTRLSFPCILFRRPPALHSF